jgi:hypothetical protein
MFKSIRYLRYDLNHDRLIYLLEDNEFICESSLHQPPREAIFARNVVAAAAVTNEYKQRNLPVAKNVALFYLFNKKLGSNIDGAALEYNQKYLDKFYPELEYGKKYYRCVCRQLKRLEFGKHASSTV